ncbi:MFS transporter [Deinococcus irradiatisoli]|uniref:MFS transporter n=1 Tax=Deinococcus irradiatisoli TaxID=2202254 RepID=A0A2Z3JEL4_9DEIO|nr:MFS transporter [Deinococcus irradiatisoli]AWN21911.1 MFS transporter [Deinococcus irradiatisoli]
MLWTRLATALRFIALLMISEFVRAGLIVAFLPLVAGRLGLSSAQVGSLVGAHYLMDALAKGPVGLVTQRLGVGGALVGSTLLGFAVLLSLLAGAAFWPLLVLAAAWGVFYAALWPSVMAASQQYARPGYQARALSVTNLSVAPGIALGTLGVGQLMLRSPTQVPALLLWLQGAALLLALSLARQRLESPAVTERWNAQWRRVAALLPAAFAQMLAPGLMVTLFYPLLRRLNLTLGDLLGPAVLGGLCLLGALLLAGRLADKLSPRAVLGPGLLLLAATFGLAGWSAELLTRWLWPLCALIGLGYGTFVAGWNGLVGQTLPPQQRAAAWGVVMATEALGYSLGPVLGGALWASGGVRVFWLGGGVFLLAQLYYALSSKRLTGEEQRPAEVAEK